MKINLNILNKPYKLDQVIEIPKKYYENSEIKELKDVYVKGTIGYNLYDEVEINLECKGIMVLEDGVTLEPIDHHFEFKIDDAISSLGEEINKSLEKNQNTLDINELLWENIVLEVPISITKNKEVELKGNGWEFKN